MRNIKEMWIAGVIGVVTLTGGCALVDEPTDTATQLIAGDHGRADIRAQYGLTGAGVSGRTFGELIGPINSTQFSQIETDLTADLGFACTRLNGCLTFETQAGSTTGPWPVNDPVQEKNLRADIFLANVANPLLKTFKIVVANDQTGANGLTAMTTLDGLGVDGAHVAVAWSETGGTFVGSMQTLIDASSAVYFAQAGKYPGTEPNVVSVATTDYSAGTADAVWANSAAKCSAVFSRQTYEPSLCSGGMRSAADISAVGHSIPITFGGSVITIDSLHAPSALVLGRASLQPLHIATRADLFAGAAAKHTDVTSGTDSLGQTAGVGTDKASGLGVPAGNLTK